MPKTQMEIRAKRVALELFIRVLDDGWAWIENHIRVEAAEYKDNVEIQTSILGYGHICLRDKSCKVYRELSDLRRFCTHPVTVAHKTRTSADGRKCVDCSCENDWADWNVSKTQ